MLGESCSTALKALSDATRWRIVKTLLGLDRANVNELAATLHRLDARVRGEFASGTTVQLNGWVLSRTEARLCALYR